jgi:FkbM family methyltransferase
MSSPAIHRGTYLAARAVLTGAVRHLPASLAAVIRRPVAAEDTPPRRGQRALLSLLSRGGIPAAVETFDVASAAKPRFAPAESLVLQQLYWRGEQGWEPELLPWWRWLCARSRAVVELGANVGYFTVQAAKAAPHVRYTAVEPHPESARMCRANLALNRISGVDVLEAAAVAGEVADAVGDRLRMRVPWEQLGTPTVAFLPADSELPADMRCRHTTTIDVATVPVRALLTDDVDLIKLDVEGQEHVLLAACAHYLHSRRPTLVVEVLTGTPKLRALLTQLCEEAGYLCLVPSPAALMPLDAQALPGVDLRRYGTHDLILVHPAGPPCAADPRLTAGVRSGRTAGSRSPTRRTWKRQQGLAWRFRHLTCPRRDTRGRYNELDCQMFLAERCLRRRDCLLGPLACRPTALV